MLTSAKYHAAWEGKQAWYRNNGYWERVVTSENRPDGSIHANTIEKIARERILGDE